MPARKVTFLSPFYGYPPKLIAAWCCVSVQTARAWKNGSKRPSKGALRLFRLHKEMRVLGDEWDGWAATTEGIVDPDGNLTRRDQIAAYWIIMQYAAALAKEHGGGYADGLRRLLRRA